MQSQQQIIQQASNSTLWGADGNVSMPQPMTAAQTASPYVDMGGFRFTSQGMQPDIRAEDIDDMLSQRYAPYNHNEIRDDLTINGVVSDG